MNKMWLMGVFFSAVVCSETKYSSGKYAGQVQVGNNQYMGFTFYLPQDWDVEKAYPTLIGPGGDRVAAANGFFWKHHPTDHGWIIIETSAMFISDRKVGAQAIEGIFKYMSARFKIEGHKFHGIGWSANSSAAFNRVLDLPARFHSITGLPGYPSKHVDETYHVLKPIKVNLVVGAQDKSWLKPMTTVHQQLLKKQVDSRLVVIPDGGHVLTELVDHGLFVELNKLR